MIQTGWGLRGGIPAITRALLQVRLRNSELPPSLPTWNDRKPYSHYSGPTIPMFVISSASRHRKVYSQNTFLTLDSN